MSYHGSGSSTKPWRPPQDNMAMYPSVGRFENKQQPTLYVKGSSPKLDGNSAKKSMAPHSNHGQLTQHPSSGIVDLRTAPPTARKTRGSNNLERGFVEDVRQNGYYHQAATYETVRIESCERCVIFNDILGFVSTFSDYIHLFCFQIHHLVTCLIC